MPKPGQDPFIFYMFDNVVDNGFSGLCLLVEKLQQHVIVQQSFPDLLTKTSLAPWVQKDTHDINQERQRYVTRLK